MKTCGEKMILLAAACLLGAAGGCGDMGERGAVLVEKVELGTTIGELGEIRYPKLVQVEGYGMVGGLQLTGSAECPPQIRAYLTRYIQRQAPAAAVNLSRLIESRETAIVRIDGVIPTAPSKGERFDIRASALAGTQTTSLEGGWLYSAELWATGGFGVANRALAVAGGPVFIEKGGGRGEALSGYVLGGARVTEEPPVTLVLRRADYRLTGVVRNRLNARFGEGTANAVQAGVIGLMVPARYKGQGEKFFAMVGAVYLEETTELTEERIRTFVRRLATQDDKYASEIALETIGNRSLSRVGILLNSSLEEVRFHAGRCMLNLGSEAGLEVLRAIAVDGKSVYRAEAVRAIGASARRADAVAMCRRLAGEADFGIRLAAYEELRNLDDPGVKQEYIDRRFGLDQVGYGGRKVVYVYRSGGPRMVLFGGPISCRGRFFVESADRSITIDGRGGGDYVLVMRRHPRRAEEIIRLRSRAVVADIIRTLCREPVAGGDGGRGGLDVSYADAGALLQEMCEKGAVDAEFRSGGLPKIDAIIKK